MIFLNSILLAGVAALLVPLIIHLLNRSRFRVIPWGAMHLLNRVINTNRRRMRLEQLILLLIRCAVPVALALCLARPVLSRLPLLAGKSTASLALLLDDSYSMRAGPPAQSSFDLALAASKQVLAAQPAGSDAAILRLGTTAQPLEDAPTRDLARLQRSLAGLEARSGPVNVSATLQAAFADLAARQQPRRALVVVSDFQQQDWTKLGEADLTRLAAQAGRGAARTALAFYRTGAEARENVCVESIELPRMAPLPGQPQTIRVHLRNHGAGTYDSLPVYWRVNGDQVAASQVRLGAGEVAQVQFTCRFAAQGSYWVEAQVDVADSLAEDNRLAAAIEVPSRLPVLLVDGAPSAQPLRGAAGFLKAALTPFASEGAGLEDLLSAELTRVDEFRAAQLAGKRAVVLANVAELSAGQLEVLKEFVSQGGGLLILPGSRINPEWYETQLFAAGLLPARLGALRGGAPENGASTAIAPRKFEHPVLQIFQDTRSGDLTEPQIQRWHKLELAPGDTAEVLASLDSGEPFLVEKSCGLGRVILAATAADSDWSNLPTCPCYVPLMQRLAVYLSSTTTPPRNVATGQPLTAYLPPSFAGKAVAWVDPAGDEHDALAEARGGEAVATFTDTRRAGLYLLKTGPDQLPLHFVVVAARSESKLDRLSEPDLEALAKKMGASVVHSGEEYTAWERQSRFGTEFWKPLLALTVLLLLADLWLAQRFARAK